MRPVGYIIEIFIVGVDTEWRNGGKSKDLITILKGFTAGQIVKVRVVAANDGGNAAPCPEAQAVIA